MVHIYCLYDNVICKPIYVGATRNPETRYKAHQNKTLVGYENKDCVDLFILEAVDDSLAGEREKFWFDTYTKQGFPLLQNACKKYPTKQTFDIDNETIGLLADAFGKSFPTIQRWILNKDDRLTSEKARRILEQKQIANS